MGSGMCMAYNFVIFHLSWPLDADFWDVWEVGSHEDRLKLITIALSSGKTLKGRLHLNQRYDRFPKTTFPEKYFLWYLIKIKGRKQNQVLTEEKERKSIDVTSSRSLGLATVHLPVSLVISSI